MGRKGGSNARARRKAKKGRMSARRDARPVALWVTDCPDQGCPICRAFKRDAEREGIHLVRIAGGEDVPPEMGEPRTGQSEALNVGPVAPGSEHAQRN